jgi:hypothetical protein
MRIVRVLSSLLLLLLVSNAFGVEKAQEQADKGEPKRGERPVSQLMQRIKKFVLTNDQQAKLAALEKEYAPRIRKTRHNADLDSVLTQEQKKARDAAQQAAKDAGKNGKEIKQAGKAAVKLSKEQKAKLADAKKEATALRRELDEKAMALLTAEQKALIETERRARSR